MSKTCRHLISKILVIMFLVSLLSGCGGPAPSSDANLVASSSKDPTVSQTNPNNVPDNKTSLPIVKEPLTLTAFFPLIAPEASKSNSDIACFKELEKRTGIHIDFISPAVGTEGEQFNLMLVSNDLPDIIYYGLLNVPGGPTKLINDKIIIPLNDHMEYAPNITKVFAEYDEARKQSMLDDGTLYMFPFLRVDPATKAGGPAIRKDWLEKLNIPVPKTMDDWYNMLKAFKERDPNGNGLSDEIPLVGTKGNDLEAITSLAGMFGIIRGFYKDGNTVRYGPIEPAYLEYLKTMNKWFTEGLIDPEFAATDGDSMAAKVTGNLAGAWIARINGTFGNFLNAMKDSGTSFDLIGTSWPVGPAGKPYNLRDDMISVNMGIGAAISTQNKHINETMRLLDYGYSDEGYLLYNFGIEGESYNLVDGKPVYSDLIMKSPKGLSPQEAKGEYCGVSTVPALGGADAFNQVLKLPQQKETIKIWAEGGDISLLVPPVSATVEESEQISQIMSDVETYVSEMFVKFVMGIEPLENYDSYLQTIKKMKIDDAVKLKQNALNRYNNRK